MRIKNYLEFSKKHVTSFVLFSFMCRICQMVATFADTLLETFTKMKYNKMNNFQ